MHVSQIGTICRSLVLLVTNHRKADSWAQYDHLTAVRCHTLSHDRHNSVVPHTITRESNVKHCTLHTSLIRCSPPPHPPRSSVATSNCTSRKPLLHFRFQHGIQMKVETMGAAPEELLDLHRKVMFSQGSDLQLLKFGGLYFKWSKGTTYYLAHIMITQ